jgi:hypothetical protein
MLVRSLIVAVMLGVVSFAQADEQTSIVNQQQLSKRPYAAPVVKSESFEGAVIKEEVVVEKKHQPLRLHMLGKLPYMEKAAD